MAAVIISGCTSQVSPPLPATNSSAAQQDLTYQATSLGNLCSTLSGCFVFCKSNVGRCSDFCKKNPAHELCAVPEAAKPQEWVKDSITQPLPEGASSIRLILPAPLDDIILNQIGAYGAHPAYGHTEGLDHEWIFVRDTAPFSSWADGEVVYVNTVEERIFDDTPSIVIYYGDGLWGEHMHVQRSLVRPGDKVKAGEPIGYGEKYAYFPGYHFAEFNLADQHRREGVVHWYTFIKGATLVSPFDYLRDDVKRQLEERWQKEIIDPFLSKGKEVEGGIEGVAGVPTLWEPYLTNPILLHREYNGTLIGEWYLRGKTWALDNVPDILVFFTNNTKYYNEQKIIASEDGEPGQTIISGDWNADYKNGRFTITTPQSIYYGIFELDETAEQAKLKIEYQEGSYPISFSEKAQIYTERETVSKAAERFYWQYPEYDPRNW